MLSMVKVERLLLLGRVSLSASGRQWRPAMETLHGIFFAPRPPPPSPPTSPYRYICFRLFTLARIREEKTRTRAREGGVQGKAGGRGGGGAANGVWDAQSHRRRL